MNEFQIIGRCRVVRPDDPIEEDRYLVQTPGKASLFAWPGVSFPHINFNLPYDPNPQTLHKEYPRNQLNHINQWFRQFSDNSVQTLSRGEGGGESGEVM